MTQPIEEQIIAKAQEAADIFVELAKLGEIGEPKNVINFLRVAEAYRLVWGLPTIEATVAHLQTLPDKYLFALVEVGVILGKTMP